MAGPATSLYNLIMTRHVPQHLFAIAISCLAASSQLSAEEASPWIDDQASSLRLIGAGRDGSPTGTALIGGIEITLQPGWKTYWRTPGDSGIPPQFDFAGSKNVATVTVLWPAPEAFDDGAGGTSLGYHGSVILPLKIKPERAGESVTLHANIHYAVCRNVCIPVTVTTNLTFGPAAADGEGRIGQALARVPKPAVIGNGGLPSILSVKRDAAAGRALIEVKAPENAPVSLFAEGPTPDWALPVPKPIEGVQKGVRRFAFKLDGAPPGASYSGAHLRLTLRSGDESFDYHIVLD